MIVAGSRTIEDYETVKREIEIFQQVLAVDGEKITEAISGTARGVDRLGERWAEENSIPIRRFPADWNKYGRSAGHRRNREMADYADALVALWDGTSRGTENMIGQALQAGLQVHVYRHNEQSTM